MQETQHLKMVRYGIKSKNYIAPSGNPETVFQIDDNLIFDESKTALNTITPKPDPEIKGPEVEKLPEIIFDDLPEKYTPEVVSIDENDIDQGLDSDDSEEIQEIADPLQEVTGKVIVEKSRSGRFLWADWPTFLPS